MGEDLRLFEYFVTVGLPENPETLERGAEECGYKNVEPQAPITDVCVIFPSLGEQVPEGFTLIETTPTGYPADLNHGSIRTSSCFLCFRRGFHKPPIVDIGILYEGKGERVMLDSQVLHTTPFGRPANVNNASNATQGIYLTYRRASDNSPQNTLAVTDICIILTNKGECAPHTFCRIEKNLNKGLVGSEVYICYKKSLANANRIAYKPAILNRFPAHDHDHFPMPMNVAIFCLPMGAVIECWPAKCHVPQKQYSTFVLTDETGTKFYGATVNFYEPHTKPLDTQQMELLGLNPEAQMNSGSVSDNSSTNDPAEQLTLHTNRAICVVSRAPFFSAFKRFLFYLHRICQSSANALPVERYISHLMYEVPFPIARRPRVLVQLGNETISFESFDDSPLPLSGAAFIDLLKNLKPENCMYLILLCLLEQKILIHSLRPWLLTSVAESICSLIFPFHWQCPYIPQCPLDLAGVLHAPLPFIAGVDSRYFELYEDPPKDVTCIDLDTATISLSDIRKTTKLSMLPKKPAKLLRQTLENLYRKVHHEEWNTRTMHQSTEFMPVDLEYKMQKRRRMLELEIHEAFLRLMASLVKGYRSYLKPIKAAPKMGSTDTQSLFDIDGFMKSRDRSAHEFYKRFCDTQLFIRFIEERSLVSDKNAFHAFFDDCEGKVDPSLDKAEPKLLEYDSALSSNHTVFIAPPETMQGFEQQLFTYPDGFPTHLDPALFQLEFLQGNKPENTLSVKPNPSAVSATPAAKRTKHESKSSQRMAVLSARTPLRWAKCLLTYAYSLWFAHLPAYLQLSASKRQALRAAFSVLDRMQTARLPVSDEVCYRVLMQLCGQYAKPLMAVKVLVLMKQQGLQPNAVTYGFYNRAVLEAKWPSMKALNAEKAWTKLRHAVRAIALFNKALRDKRRQRRTASQYSTDSTNGLQTTTLVIEQAQKADSNSWSGKGRGLTGNYDKPTDTGYCSLTGTEDSTSNGGHPFGDTESQPSLMSSNLDASASSSLAQPFLNDSDLELFEQLHSRTPNIAQVDSDELALMRSVSMDAYDSPAGLLMTSLPNYQQIKVSPVKRSSVGEWKEVRPKSLNVADDVAEESSLGTVTPKLPVTPMTSPSPMTNCITPINLAGDAHIIKQILEDEQGRSRDSSRETTPTHIRVTPTRTTVSRKEAPLGDLHESEQLETLPEQDTSANKSLLDQEPFQDEVFKSDEVPSTPLSGFARASVRGWLNKFNLQNTPVSKIIRSQTTQADLCARPNEESTPLVDEGLGMPISPSLRDMVNQANTAVRSKVTTAINKQQPTISKLRSGVTSVMKEFRNIKGGLDSLGSPVRGSLASLTETDSLNMLEDDCASLNQEEGLLNSSLSYVGMWFGRSPAPNPATLESDQWSVSSANAISQTKLPDNDPAFQLSSGETGNILNFDVPFSLPKFGMNEEKEGSGNEDTFMECVLCACSRCPHCSSLLYDEEIMAGWKAEESNLNTNCSFCKKDMVPILTVQIRLFQASAKLRRGSVCDSLRCPISPSSSYRMLDDSWYVQTPKSGKRDSVGKSCDSLSSWSETGNQKQGVKMRAKSDSVNKQLFVERKKKEIDDRTSDLEDKEQQNQTQKPAFSCASETNLKVPLLSPLVLRKELENVVGEDGTPLCSPHFVETHPILYWNMLYFFQRLSVPSHLAQWIAYINWFNAAEFEPPKDGSLAPTVVVRCVHDLPKLHEDECTTPLYVTALKEKLLGAGTAKESPLLAALLLEGREMKETLIHQIVQYVTVPQLHKPIQLLINEHRKRGPKSGTHHALPKHCSIYRDLLFLAEASLGNKKVDREMFDREYNSALCQLPPRIASLLPPADMVPSLSAKACRRVFMPLDVC